MVDVFEYERVRKPKSFCGYDIEIPVELVADDNLIKDAKYKQ